MLKEVERDTMIDTVKEASLEVHIEMGHMSTIDQERSRDRTSRERSRSIDRNRRSRSHESRDYKKR